MIESTGELHSPDRNNTMNVIEIRMEEIHKNLTKKNGKITTTKNSQQKPLKKVQFNSNAAKQTRSVREICINMSRNINDDKEEEKIVQNTLTSVATLIYAWKMNNLIESVLTEGNTEVDPTTTNICK